MSHSHGARPVHQIISMINWIWTSRLSIKNSLCWCWCCCASMRDGQIQWMPKWSNHRSNCTWACDIFWELVLRDEHENCQNIRMVQTSSVVKTGQNLILGAGQKPDFGTSAAAAGRGGSSAAPPPASAASANQVPEVVQ